jgi:hypothetical protein
MMGRNTLFTVIGIAACLMALAGCRAEEQGRILFYDKGTYLGPKEPPLSAEKLKELRKRTSEQVGPAVPVHAPGARAPGGPGVRPPTSAAIDVEALRARASAQAGLVGTAGAGGGGAVRATGEGPPSASSVRPPAASNIDEEALRQRSLRQGY